MKIRTRSAEDRITLQLWHGSMENVSFFPRFFLDTQRSLKGDPRSLWRVALAYS
jgi:hypothetical protein